VIQKQILDLIEKYDTIIIHHHVMPDPDCIGSQLGLKYLINHAYPKKKVYAVGTHAERTTFLGNLDEVLDEKYQEALVIIVDVGNKARIDDDRFLNGKAIIKIDHHPQTEIFADIEWVDTNYASVTEMIIDLYLQNNDKLEMTIEAARVLYAGTLTDTGRFYHHNVTARTLMYGAEVYQFNFNKQELYADLYLKSIDEVKFKGYILNHFSYTKNGLGFMKLNEELLETFHITPEYASTEVNTLANIKEIMTWIFFIEYKETGKIRVEFRSRGPIVIEWSSSDATIIDADGKVIRPAVSTEVTLTATLTIYDTDGTTVIATAASPYSKVVTVVGTDVNTINSILNINVADDIDDIMWFTIQGTVFGIESDGYFIYDGTDEIFVYTSDFTATVGDKVQLVGYLKYYSGQPEFTDLLSTTYLLSDNQLPVIDAVYTSIGALPDGKDANDYGNYVELTGFVTIEGSYNNVFVYDIITGDVIEIYYNSNADAVEPFEGKIVTLRGILHSVRGGHWRVSVVNNNVVETVIPEAELQEAAKGMLTIPRDTVSNLVLPATDMTGEVTITWESDTPATIANDGTVTLPATGTVDVIMTATFTIGDSIDITKTFTVTVVKPAPPTDLFFSQYMEGGGSNKVLEIYNGTGAAIDLTDYYIVTFTNGASQDPTDGKYTNIFFISYTSFFI